MKKILVILFFLLIHLSCFSQETLTITTYYPSPSGVYKILKLEPGDPPACSPGTLFYDNDDAADDSLIAGLYYCDSGTPSLPQLLGAAAGGGGAALWSGAVLGDISNSNTGNVGIGTTTPLANLHVGNTTIRDNGNTRLLVGSSSLTNFIEINNNDATAGMLVGMNNATTGLIANDGDLWLSPGYTAKMAITSAGNVGIGTIAPASLLDVAGTISGNDITCPNCLGANEINSGEIQQRVTGQCVGGVLVGINQNGTVNCELDDVVAPGPGGGLTSINGMTGPAIGIAGGAGIAIANAANTVTITNTGIAGVGGFGTTNYVSKWTAGNTLGNSLIYDDGTNVGIGTTSPRTRLELGNDGAILASGAYGGGWTEPNLGAGTRLLWYPRKAAFRVGSVNGTQWNNAQIGPYSIAMGIDTTASGQESTAMGAFTTASGDYSTAMGYKTTANNSRSTAMGNGTTASGSSSTAMGYKTTASGDYSTAMGDMATASGEGSFAVGASSSAIGLRSVAFGIFSKASGEESTAMGPDISVEGLNSFGISLKNAQSYKMTKNNTMAIMGGKVGIGTVDPIGKFQVQTDSGTNAFYVNTSDPLGLELRSAGTPYIDFSNDAGIDYDVRLILTGDNTLALVGGTHDIAENIPCEEGLEGGDVVVIDTENKVKVKKSTRPYDTLVAGIISGEPGFLIQGDGKGLPLALAGRVKTKVTTENGPIKIGDLLTTSSTPGYAMKAAELKIGTILGKAMEPLNKGKGKIVVLVTL